MFALIFALCKKCLKPLQTFPEWSNDVHFSTFHNTIIHMHKSVLVTSLLFTLTKLIKVTMYIIAISCEKLFTITLDDLIFVEATTLYFYKDLFDYFIKQSLTNLNIFV